MKDQLTFWQVVRMLWDVEGWRWRLPDGALNLAFYQKTGHYVFLDTACDVRIGLGTGYSPTVFAYSFNAITMLLVSQPLCWRIRRHLNTR